MITCVPEINTTRLLLRALENSDATRIQRLAGDEAIADMTDNIPHPYEDGMAEAWIDKTRNHWSKGQVATFAICLKGSEELIGCCGLTIVPKHRRATLGYWIGRDYWGNGFCTEAATEVVAFGFTELELHRIAAMHLCINPASGAVMRKLGMKREAILRNYVLRKNKFEDMALYAIFAD